VLGEEGHKLAPGVGEFGEAVEQEDKGFLGGAGGIAGFEDVEVEAGGWTVDVIFCDAFGEGEGRERWSVRCGHDDQVS